MPAIERNYVIVVMIFPKTVSANCNIFHLTIFFFFLMCVCIHTCLRAVLFHEKVKLVLHSESASSS